MGSPEIGLGHLWHKITSGSARFSSGSPVLLLVIALRAAFVGSLRFIKSRASLGSLGSADRADRMSHPHNDVRPLFCCYYFLLACLGYY